MEKRYIKTIFSIFISFWGNKIKIWSLRMDFISIFIYFSHLYLDFFFADFWFNIMLKRERLNIYIVYRFIKENRNNFYGFF